MAKETKSRFLRVQTLSLEKKVFGFPKKQFTKITGV